jgi:hypothetical protein
MQLLLLILHDSSWEQREKLFDEEVVQVKEGRRKRSLYAVENVRLKYSSLGGVGGP